MRLSILTGVCGVALALLNCPVQAQQAQTASPTPVAVYRAGDVKGVADGAPLAVWPDGAGKNEASQTVAAQQPVWVARAFGTLPGVRFDAAKKTFLSLARPVQDDFTIVCVFQSAQGQSLGDDWRLGAGLVGPPAEVWDPSKGQDDFGLSLNARGQVLGGTGDWDRDFSTDRGFNDGKPHVVMLRRVKKEGEIALYVDGALVDSFSGANKQALSQTKTLMLGMMQRNSGTQTYFTGDLGEVDFYDVALGEADRQALEQSLERQYGVAPLVQTGSPPSSVPVSARTGPVILPPDSKPGIHGPKIMGASPNRPFLFRIPATGAAPLAFACADLPPGLNVDAKTGQITGAITTAGTYTLHLSASNAQGTASRVLTLVCGDHKLALTPPMGWDAGNIWGNLIDDAKTRDAADSLVKSGLAAHGWSTVHINDSWQATRSASGDILPNRRRFPDIKALADYLHGQGLYFGLLSSATEHTCTGFVGSLGHETQDVGTYAQWGVDYLEYAWCPNFLDEQKAPNDMPAQFRTMRTALDKTPRDLVYAVNTFAKNAPWDWGPSVSANSWVTSGQIYDDWEIVKGAYFGPDWWTEKAGPGHWNNPGLLMIGNFGVGDIHRSRLSALEQMSQFSQAALLASPLWLSCDLATLDPNTFHPFVSALLTNDEVLDIDQDPLGHAASQIIKSRQFTIWSRPLSDGTQAVGLFNLGETARTVRVRLSDLGLTGPQPVRDLWLHQDLGAFDQTFATAIPPHGVALVKIGKAP